MLLDPRSHFKQILFLAAHSWSCTCCVESKLSRDAVKSAIDSLSYGIGRDIGRSSSICPCLWESVYLSDLNICYGCISILKANITLSSSILLQKIFGESGFPLWKARSVKGQYSMTYEYVFICEWLHSKAKALYFQKLKMQTKIRAINFLIHARGYY